MMLDRLDALLQRFSVSADLFHAGPLCGINDLQAVPNQGHLHVIGRGDVQVQHADLPALAISQPSLLFYPRAQGHRFVTDAATGANMVCATVQFNGGRENPIARALPPVLVVPLGEAEASARTVALLFDEALNPRCGWRASANRLFEVLLIQLLRRVLDQGLVEEGMLAGLGHPHLRKALVAMHEAPARPWSLEDLAIVAGLSRSRFARSFKDVVGTTAGDYLAGWRINLAQELLRRGRPLKLIAEQVGYASPVALNRVFKQRVGVSPRAWRQALAQ